ncbi:hypothetical protein CRUP_027225 [Coryphaenoides rupestris]|nr:hypothetical protein CRUP_027225 [Coryphaenoides rupestris]
MIITTAFDAFVLGCLVAGVRCETDKPSALTLESVYWVTNFCYNVSWTVQNQRKNCSYVLNHKSLGPRTQFSEWHIMEGGVLNVSLVANCGGGWSQTAHRSIVNTALVRDLWCDLRSSNSTVCTWKPASSQHIPDLRVYYLKSKEHYEPCPHAHAEAECPEYQRDADGAVTGCVLPSKLQSHFFFAFNGTDARGNPARNTFERTPYQNLGDWKYIINYIKCGEHMPDLEITNGTTSLDFQLNGCAINISMMAKWGIYHTAPGPVMSFGKDPNPNTPKLLAGILIPVALAAMLLLAMVCFRRNKDAIFPAVPKPADFLPDMMSSNKALNTMTMYEPAQEEEPEIVTLIVDPDP